ncbi:universal stress protein [Gordonia crocea]|uniref:Universal stress protein n=1 Tax=Gordonia crocea TaxID=589162 RepID=A0A7I9UXK5_9ACTN|nr:universal stress protein [Gordonia crocea]
MVAVDGSDPALQAVRWAAAAAARENRPLRVVSVVEPAVPQAGYGIVTAQAYVDASRAFAEGAVDLARDVSAEAAPTATVTGDVLDGRPALVLREVSEHAHVVVLGRRGLGGAEGLALGSVTADLAAHGQSPVVVVPEDTPTAGPVVVGVDGSPVSTGAIRTAFEQADFLGVPLIAVHAFGERGLALENLSEEQRRRISDEAVEALGSQLAGGLEDHPDVSVETVVAAAGPAQQILDAAREAQLVVVGSRGRGGFRGLLLGSTSQAVLHTAPCAVMIVRD